MTQSLADELRERAGNSLTRTKTQELLLRAASRLTVDEAMVERFRASWLEQTGGFASLWPENVHRALTAAINGEPDMTDEKPREQTYGERAVGLTFNPSSSKRVDMCKAIFAAAIDQMDNLRKESDDPEVRRMASVAITEAQTAQMWAVKALTWGRS